LGSSLINLWASWLSLLYNFSLISL
jgi:hypothetical protein